MTLAVELVPAPLWGRNLRRELPPDEWRRLSYDVRKRAGFRCRVCGCHPSSPLHCDEVWAYNDETHIATLIDLRSICEDCHAVKHMGHSAIAMGAEKARAFAKAGLMYVNGWDEVTAEVHIQSAGDRWRERCRHEWTLDLGRWAPGRGVAARCGSEKVGRTIGASVATGAPVPSLPHEPIFPPLPPDRRYLAVPFAEKDEAKRLGARWDPKRRLWWVPITSDPVAYARWAVVGAVIIPVDGPIVVHEELLTVAQQRQVFDDCGSDAIYILHPETGRQAAVAYVHGMGRPLGLPLNRRASRLLTGRSAYDRVVGPVIFTGLPGDVDGMDPCPRWLVDLTLDPALELGVRPQAPEKPAVGEESDPTLTVKEVTLEDVLQLWEESQGQAAYRTAPRPPDEQEGHKTRYWSGDGGGAPSRCWPVGPVRASGGRRCGKGSKDVGHWRSWPSYADRPPGGPGRTARAEGR
jgi:hypothetical protein